MTFDTMNHPTAASSSPALGAGAEASQRNMPGNRVAPAGGPPSLRPSLAVERWLMRKALAACGNPAVRVVLWDGEGISTSEELPVGNILVHDPATLRRLIADPRIAFGEGYSDGSI